MHHPFLEFPSSRLGGIDSASARLVEHQNNPTHAVRFGHNWHKISFLFGLALIIIERQLLPKDIFHSTAGSVLQIASSAVITKGRLQYFCLDDNHTP